MPPGAVAVDRAELASEGGREQAGDVPIEAVPVVRVEPEYPRKAARAGREGWVKLGFTITPSGGVANVRVLESRPRRVFDRAAKRALEQWRFRPQRIEGQALAREAVQVIEFKLAGRG
jgi:protein TonB